MIGARDKDNDKARTKDKARDRDRVAIGSVACRWVACLL